MAPTHTLLLPGRGFLASVGLSLLAVGLVLGVPLELPGGAPPATTPAAASQLLADLPVTFVEIRGQVAGSARFYVAGADKSLFFGPDGVTIRLRGAARSGDGSPAATAAVRVEFAGANAHVEPEGEERAPGTVSFFRGRPSEWKTGVPTYAALRYRELWPGIDLVYRGDRGRVKYQFEVRPGADPSRIRLRYRGAEAVRLTHAGALETVTAAGSLTDEKPVSYQEAAGRQVPVKTAYQVQEDAEGAEVRFRLGSYDPSRPLVIDPAVLVWCTLVRGADQDTVDSIALDRSGHIYVAGGTVSTPDTFPVTVRPGSRNTEGCAFVAKFRPGGRSLVYCGFIEGDTSVGDVRLAVDDEGAAYLAGETLPEGELPVKAGPSLVSHGDADGWVAKVSPDGTSLEYCGYTGGGVVYGIAVDGSGSAYVCGFTRSPTLPVRSGPVLSLHSANEPEGFVAKVRPDGTGYVYCGYTGGSFATGVQAIAVDGEGRAYLGGYAYRTPWEPSDFPVRIGPDLTSNGEAEAWVARVSQNGSHYEYCGFIGGAASEWATSIAVDAAGQAYLVGWTSSDERTFPARVGPDLSYAGEGDAWIAKVRADGAGLVYCGYIGGDGPKKQFEGTVDGRDEALGVGVDAAGRAYVVGSTTTPEAYFPVRDGPDLKFHGRLEPISYDSSGHPHYAADAFIARVAADGRALEYCGYIGSVGNDYATGVAVDGAGNAYVGGTTGRKTHFFPARSGMELAVDRPYRYSSDGFIARVSTHPAPSTQPGRLRVWPRSAASRLVAGGRRRWHFGVRNSGAGVLVVNVPPLPPPFAVSPTGDVRLAPGQRREITVTFQPEAAGEWELPLTLTSSDPRHPLLVIPIRATAVAPAGGGTR